ncbi:MAG: 3'-5' exonuclease [Bacteroidales bacterium]|nr:3'-5' exonuclease [Bacteroidales bacterium]
MSEYLSSIKNENILFLDIETVSQYQTYTAMPHILRVLWDKKSKKFIDEQFNSPEKAYCKAGILAEFGKIICISAGYIITRKNKKELRVRSFYGNDEAQILTDFLQLFTKYFNTDNHYLCAHNGKEFDFPYIARRALINGIKLPQKFDTRGLKPWEVRHSDTLDLWRFGDYKNYTSLELLTAIFDIPSPKSDLDGSMVNEAYWKDNKNEEIMNYCQKDVVAIVQLYMKYKSEELFTDEQIKIV